MPKGTAVASARARGSYAAQACIICRARKIKCDGVKPVCGSCSGRNDECAWGRDNAARKPRTEAHFEALRKRTDALQAYVDLLEGILAKCVCQDISAHLACRPHQPEEIGGKDKGDWNPDPLDSDEEISKELCIPTQFLKLDDRLGGILRHGITTPYRFAPKPPNSESRAKDDVENPIASYKLLVDGADATDHDLNFDWSRYLPLEVPLNRKEHDRILDLSFKFFTMLFLRIVPTLFLRDMHRALSAPPSHRPPKTPFYSPMLHNALLAVATIYSDDPHIRDPKSRRYFAVAAKNCLEAESHKPNVSLVHALAFLGTYYSDEGDHILADLYCAMSARLSLLLGLGVDSSALVKSGLITNDERLGRNWAHWTIFSLDVCWALFFGRDFCGPPLDRRAILLPFGDSEFDQISWDHAPANIPPQPSLLSLTFSASASLLLIARKIIDVVNGLGNRDCTPQETVQNDELITKIDLELYNWKSQLSPELDITSVNRTTSTPQQLMLHCLYWWCFILLHRPFFNRRARTIQTTEREIDHVKLCKRGAENILELLQTWCTLYTLRYTPVTMLQVVFSCGTVFLLLSLQATSSFRIAHGQLEASLSQAELCIQHLLEIGQSWRAALRTGEILRGLLYDKLKPILARRFAHEALLNPVEVPVSSSAGHSAAQAVSSASSESAAVSNNVAVSHPAEDTQWNTSQNAQLLSGGNEDVAWSQMSFDFSNQRMADSFIESSGFPLMDPLPGAFSDLGMPELVLPTFDSFASSEPIFDNRPGNLYFSDLPQFYFDN
ncbi:hypothetical protein B0H10DRAFT_654938 [Mycena sp. CBHHK59/15]|nr:hypothetical protein B0H10DRAFT_654938 [Mycena sp. CBHHK59/15]